MLIIITTILIGLFISLITLPLGYYAPEWILLIVTYWGIATPSNSKLVLAFFSGIIVDIVFGQVLGISSLLYVILIYLVLKLYNSLRYMTVSASRRSICSNTDKTTPIYMDILYDG